MKFFFPDSQDFVDPSFDFVREIRFDLRVRQRDDLYPHEVFAYPPYDGMLISKTVVDGFGSAGRYSMGQRNRFYREGVKRYVRLGSLETMGDCGAFSYVREEVPPFSVDEVIDFYSMCGFDYGISVDHVILGYNPKADSSLPDLDLTPKVWRVRQEITLELADQFFKRHRTRKERFTPLGVAQGWSQKSYVAAVIQLQKMGYRYIALGGLVLVRTNEIMACLEAIKVVRHGNTKFHLLGVTRKEKMTNFRALGVASFDSTSPLKQAFKDNRDNYYTPDGALPAIRIPQVDGNLSLKRQILSGTVDQDVARRLERRCFKSMIDYDRGAISLNKAVKDLRSYEQIFAPEENREEEYRTILGAKPWTKCPCQICQTIGIHVILFRGAERNRRRGFHNLFVFRQQLERTGLVPSHERALSEAI